MSPDANDILRRAREIAYVPPVIDPVLEQYIKNPPVSRAEALATRTDAGQLRLRLLRIMAAIDRNTGPDREVWIRFASPGGAVQFFPEKINALDPDLICFVGSAGEGADMVLVQHVTQVNVLFVTVPKPDPDQPKRRIGFADTDEGNSVPG